MARRNELLYALNAGGVDGDALSRVDLEKLRLAGEHPVSNWLPRVLGPMSLRPGTQHLDTLSQQTRMVEFVRDASTTALLLFGNQVAAIYDNDGVPVPVANAASTITNPTFTSGGGGWTDVSDTGAGTDGVASMSGNIAEFIATKYRAAALQQSVTIASGDQATAHTIRIVVSRGPVFFRIGSTSGGEEVLGEERLLTGTHKLTFTPSTGTIYLRFRSEDRVARYVSECRFEHTALGGAGELVLPTPWTTADLEYLSWDQEDDTDVIFMGDGTYQPRRIERRGASSWSIVLYQTRNGPLQAPDTDKVTLAGTAVRINGTLSSNIPYFKSSHVGCLFELTHPVDYTQEEFHANNQTTDYVTVRGLFSSTKNFDDRNLSVTIDFTTGSFVGTIALEGSYDATGDVWAVQETYESASGNVSATWNDEQSNLVVHYRFRVIAYTSGYATVTLQYQSGSRTGLVRVTSYSSSTSVGYEVVNRLSSTGATSSWRGPVWSDTLGWPRVPQFRDGRLHWFLRGRDFASIVDDWDNYDDGVDGDAGPITRYVGGEVRWALDMDRLAVGMSDRVSAVQASEFNEIVTPTSWSVRPGPSIGASYVRPGQIDDIAIMADKTGRRLYDVFVPEGGAKLKSTDVSRLLPNGLNSGVVDIAVQRQPDTRLYIVMGDGTCIVLTYERDDKVIAFTTIETDGTIEDVAVLPDDDQDDVYFVVLRAGVRYLERLSPEYEQRSLSTCTLLDAYKVLTGSISSITGGSHLASRTVHVFADGIYRGTSALNASGVGALPGTYARVVYGLTYDAEFLSVKLAYAAQLGTAIGALKQVRRAAPILSNSVLDGIRIGKDATNTDTLPPYYNGAARTTGQFFTHYDEETLVIPGEWDADSRVYLKASSHYGPVTVQALVVDVETREGVGGSKDG